VDYLLAQIQGYQAADAQRVGELARAKLGLSGMVRQWVELYGRLRPVARPQQEEEAVLRLLQNLNGRLFCLSETEAKLAAMQAAYGDRDGEMAGLQKKLRKAVQFRGILKHFWKFPPSRALMRMLGARKLTP